MPDKPIFCFLNLPLEIREEIYYHALQQPPRHSLPSGTVSVVTAAFKSDDTWCGTEQMTRLLRVNRQVHHEAEGVLYSRFRFSFPHYTTAQAVHTVLDPLSARARALLRTVKVDVILRLRIPPEGGYADPVSKRNEALAKEAFALLVELLPGLREVEFALAFVGMKVPDEERRHVVELALRIVSPLRHVEKLTLSPMSTFEGQRLQIWREVVQRVHAGSW